MVFRSSGATTTTPVTLFSDGFEKALDWTRLGDATWHTGSPKNGTHSARLRTKGAIEKSVSTKGFKDITVSFSMGAYSLDSARENMQALYYNGSVWKLLAEIKNATTNENNKLNTYLIKLPAEAADFQSLRLRFKLNGSAINDYGYVDDVVLQGMPVVPAISAPAPAPTTASN